MSTIFDQHIIFSAPPFAGAGRFIERVKRNAPHIHIASTLSIRERMGWDDSSDYDVFDAYVSLYGIPQFYVSSYFELGGRAPVTMAVLGNIAGTKVAERRLNGSFDFARQLDQHMRVTILPPVPKYERLALEGAKTDAEFQQAIKVYEYLEKDALGRVSHGLTRVPVLRSFPLVPE